MYNQNKAMYQKEYKPNLKLILEKQKRPHEPNKTEPKYEPQSQSQRNESHQTREPCKPRKPKKNCAS